jgi:hypothetical protein
MVDLRSIEAPAVGGRNALNLDAMLSLLPPWLVIAPLIGVIHGSLLFMIVGRRPTSLPVYLALGIAAASLMQALQLVPPGPPPFSIGEVHLVATSLATWAVILGSRAAGL